MNVQNAEIEELDEFETLQVNETAEKPGKRGKTAKPTLDYNTMTTAAMLKASGEALQGFGSKRELVRLLEERGYTVLNVPNRRG